MNRHGNSLNDHSMIILNTVQVVKLTVFVGNRVLPRVELSGNCWAEFSLSSECLFQAVGNKKKTKQKKEKKNAELNAQVAISQQGWFNLVPAAISHSIFHHWWPLQPDGDLSI